MTAIPGPDAASALFFDFDGTLVELAARPNQIVVPRGLPERLVRLAGMFGGALALVSGRPISQIDQFLQPQVLPVAGVHGAERRTCDGQVLQQELIGLGKVADKLQAWSSAYPSLLLERKPGAIALHYRGADALEAICIEAMNAAAQELPGMSLMHGKKVLELKPRLASKGAALLEFLAEPPFAQRRPYFFGDDVTDESGFSVVQELGGIAVKVGEGESLARYRLAGPAAVLQWMDSLLGT